MTDTPVMDDEGNLVGIIGVSTDITDLKKKEEEILRLNAELEARVLERTQQLEKSNALLREEVQEHLRAREHLHMVAKVRHQCHYLTVSPCHCSLALLSCRLANCCWGRRCRSSSFPPAPPHDHYSPSLCHQYHYVTVYHATRVTAHLYF